MYPDDIEEKIKQFQDAIGTPEYNSAIEDLIRTAYDYKIQIILSVQPSHARPENEIFSGSYVVKILRLPKSGNSKEILFDMMHEMGHCFDPNKLLPDKSNEKERERRAWEFADEKIGSYPELATAMQEYTDFKNSHLETYLNA